MVTRAKLLLVAAFALHMFLIFLNNVTDYAVNFPFVQHTLSMDTVYGTSNDWRAINAPWLHHVFYCSIILWELLVATLCAWGSLTMWRNVTTEAVQSGRKMVVMGLTAGMLLWLTAFISVGGEWFLSWLSADWNGTPTAYKLFPINGIIFLIFIVPHSDN